MAEPSAALDRTSGARTGSVSVIVPTWNEAKYLPALLASLTNQTRAPLEIVVADSGSTDGTQDLADARGAFVVEGERRGARGGRVPGGPARTGGARVVVCPGLHC